jgi:ArsR family transcriptional regulator, arsenate/arsenite/antimonite-responsive transcriptional repressor
MSTHLAFDALADEVRRSILQVIADRGECSAGEIADSVDRVGRTTVSSHLRVLRTSGVIVERRAGRHRYYSLDPEGPARAATVSSATSTTEPTGQPASRRGSDPLGAAASASALSSRSDDCSKPCRNSRAARAGPSGFSE